MATSWLDEYGMTPDRWSKLKGSFGDGGGQGPRAGSVTVAPAYSPPASPAGAVTLSPGFTPDYRGLIMSDPAYTSWKNDATLSVAQAAAQRRAALRAMAVRYGGLGPVSDAYGDIDSATLDLAKQNQYSDVAQLERAYKEGVGNLKSNLAARGMLQSSDLGAGMAQADYQRGASEYDLGQQYASAFQSALNDYINAEAAARQREVGAVQAAEQSVFSNPLNVPTAPTTASLVSDWQTKYGRPIYTGPDGNLYNSDGTPYEPTVTAPPAATPPPEAPWTGGDWTSSYDPYALALRGLTYAA